MVKWVRILKKQKKSRRGLVSESIGVVETWEKGAGVECWSC